jgi:hypothetical protein
VKIAELFAALEIRPDQKSLKRVDAMLGAAKQTLKRFAVVTGVAAAGAGKMISDVAKSADEFSKMSRKVGISVEKLQQLEFASNLSGTNLASLRVGLQRFARTADDAGQGLKTAQEPFERLGVATHDASGDLKDLDTLLLETADAIAKLPDGTEKTALAMKAFGRSGAELIPLLNEGSVGIERMRKEFAGMGAQISTEDARAFEEYNDTILRVKTTLIGFRNQAVVALLPHLKAAAKSVMEWFKANREVIKQNLIKFMRILIKVLRIVGKTFAFVVTNGEALLRFYVAWRAAMLLVLAAQKVLAAGSVAAAIKIGLAWALANAPLILMIALIALIALVIEDVIAAITGKESVIGEVWQRITDWWRDALREFFEWLEDKLKGVEDFINRIKNLPRKVAAKLGLAVDYDREIEGAREDFGAIRLTETVIPDFAQQARVSPRLTPEEGGGFQREGFGVTVNQTITAPDPETAGRLSAEGMAREINQAVTP